MRTVALVFCSFLLVGLAQAEPSEIEKALKKYEQTSPSPIPPGSTAADEVKRRLKWWEENMPQYAPGSPYYRPTSNPSYDTPPPGPGLPPVREVPVERPVVREVPVERPVERPVVREVPVERPVVREVPVPQVPIKVLPVEVPVPAKAKVQPLEPPVPDK